MKKSKDEWIALIKQQEESNQSIRAFCIDQNIHPNSFHYQKQKNKRDEQTDMVELNAMPRRNQSRSQLVVRIGNIEIIPGDSPDPRVIRNLFISALEAINVVL